MSSAEEKFAWAKQKVVLDHPEWAALILELEIKEGNNLRYQTMETDGRYIYFDRTFVDALSKESVLFVLAHEGLHCGLKHHLRKPCVEYDISRWNMALDYAINPILVETGLEMPEGENTGLLEDKYSGMCAEEIYPLLPKSLKKNFYLGHVIASDQADQADQAEQDRKWTRAMANCLYLGKQSGAFSEKTRLILGDSLEPKISWKDRLWGMVVRHAGQEDYTWARPSRRGRALGIYLPSLYAERMPPLAICIDTSGSMMDPKILAMVVAEARSAINATKPTQTIVICADCEVTSVDTLEPDDHWEPKLIGGGGTDFTSALKEAEKHDPACIIYLTDLCGSCKWEPSIPVIWASTDRTVKPAFGEVVYIEGE